MIAWLIAAQSAYRKFNELEINPICEISRLIESFRKPAVIDMQNDCMKRRVVDLLRRTLILSNLNEDKTRDVIKKNFA